MATINRENIGLLNDRLIVKVNQEDYLPNFEKELKRLSRQSNMPGFRKGMVPTGLIRKMEGQSVFTREVIKSVENELTEYLKKEQLNLLGEPIPENIESVHVDMNKPEEYQFNFEIGLKPEIDITPLSNGFHFTRYKVITEEKDIDEEIKRLQKRAGRREEKMEITSADDILKLQFQPSDSEGKVTEGAEAKEESIVLSYFSPEKNKSLTGKKTGYSETIKLNDAFEKQEADWIIKDWKLEDDKAADQFYVMTIQKIEEIIPKELSEDFYNEIFPGEEIKTEDAFRERIKKDDEAHWNQESEKRLDHDIFEKLVHETPVELPEGFLKKWLRQDGKEQKTDEEIAQSYPQFEHDMRWSLISGKIMRDNQIEVSADELKHHFRHRLAAYLGLDPHDESNERMEGLVNSMMQNEKTVNDSYSQLLTARLFDFLRNKAEIEEKEITASEFIKLPHNHQHEH